MQSDQTSSLTVAAVAAASVVANAAVALFAPGSWPVLLMPLACVLCAAAGALDRSVAPAWLGGAAMAGMVIPAGALVLSRLGEDAGTGVSLVAAATWVMFAGTVCFALSAGAAWSVQQVRSGPSARAPRRGTNERSASHRP